MSAPAATALSERALGPDLARGAMLLFIALANSHYFLLGSAYAGGFPRPGNRADAAVAWFISTFVDGRAFPMFGLLFGYGVAHIVRRNARLGRWPLRRLLWRRALVLVVVGVVDALLFYAGDILAMYGVLLFAGAWLVRLRDRWLLVLGLACFVLTSLPGLDSMSIATAGPDSAALPTSLGEQLRGRWIAAAFVAVLGPIGFASAFAFGLLAGRRQLLEDVPRHARTLRVAAIGGIAAAVLGAQPVALYIAGLYGRPADDVLLLVGPLHDASGTLGGYGYAAAICLIATRLRPTGLVRAIAATGQRSMTCYLLQSPVWWIVYTPYLLGLADDLSIAANAALAAAVWAVSVALAGWMWRTRRRGPFELLIRRVTYRGA